jgi:CRP/FNR family transcriptional regulator, cyclic AMP receptor protein
MSTTPILELLRSQPFFAGLSETDLSFLAAQARLQEFHNGDYIFFEGEPAADMHLILSGEVALEVSAGNLGLVAIDHLGANEVIGKSALLPPYRYSLNAKAEAPTQVVIFSAEPIRARCESDVRLGYDIMRRLALVASRRLVATRKCLLEQLS